MGTGPNGEFLTGGLEGTAMTLANTGNRVSYTPAADGSVRLLWKKSYDSGKTWEQVTESIYKRAPKRSASTARPNY